MHWKLMFTALFHGIFAMVSAYYITILNSLEPFIKEFANASVTSHYGVNMDSGQLALVWAIIVSAYPLGGAIGPFIVKYFGEKHGRRNTVMIYNNILLICTGFLMFCAVQYFNSIELLIIGRFFTGVSRSASWFTSTFLAECSPTESRGFVSLVTAVGTRVWLICALAGALPSVWGTPEYWPYLFILPAIPCMIHMSMYWYFPRSPKYLYITLDKKNESETSLSFYHGQNVDVPKIHADYDKERALQRDASAHSTSLGEILGYRQYRTPFLLCLGVVLTPALAGADLALHYSTGIMINLGVAVENAALFSLLVVHLPSVFVTIIAVLTVDRIGRRVNLLVGFATGLLAVGVLFACAITIQYFYPDTELPTSLMIISVVSFMFITCGHAFGPAFVHAIMPGELCPQAIRSTTWSYSMGSTFLSKFIFLLWFPPVQELVGSYALLPSVLIGWIIWVLLYVYLPETRGKTVEETHRAAGWIVSNDKEVIGMTGKGKAV